MARITPVIDVQRLSNRQIEVLQELNTGVRRFLHVPDVFHTSLEKLWRGMISARNLTLHTSPCTYISIWARNGPMASWHFRGRVWTRDLLFNDAASFRQAMLGPLRQMMWHDGLMLPDCGAWIDYSAFQLMDAVLAPADENDEPLADAECAFGITRMIEWRVDTLNPLVPLPAITSHRRIRAATAAPAPPQLCRAASLAPLDPRAATPSVPP